MEMLKGIAASRGIAIAKAYRLVEPDFSIVKKMIEDVEEELKRFQMALESSKKELEDIREKAQVEMGTDKAAIFEAHLLVLIDPEFVSKIVDKIESEKINAEYALKEVRDMFFAMFEQMDNEYLKERKGDIRDVTNRILSHLLGVSIVNPSMILEESIIVADDLTPSETAQLNCMYVKGFTTNVGGLTSHSAIMAHSMGIPAVVGTKTATMDIQHGDLIIVDGIKGEVYINPTEEVLVKYREKLVLFEEKKAGWAKLVNKKTITLDGQSVELSANIGTSEDLESVIKNGGEAIGLYRTEYLYMGRSELPSEEEQFRSYKAVLEGMNGKPVVVRTLDIGGDKDLGYLNLPKELNPFLGFRAIRLCLEEQEIFRTQLRALLRASTFGNLKIMFPMIANLDEFRAAKAILVEEREKLSIKGFKISNTIEIGIMVEIPSTAVMADQFAKEVDFFSIGTNDLIQYTMAADRMNERVSYLYQPYNPAILRLIKMVIDAAHTQGKWVGLCGEMAGDEIAVPLLLGMGLDKFSMSATSILKIRSQLLHLSKREMKSLVVEALQMGTSKEVIAAVKKATEKPSL